MAPVTDEAQDTTPAPTAARRRLPVWAVGMLWTTAGIVAAVVTVSALNAPHTSTAPAAAAAPTSGTVQGWIQVGNAGLLDTAGDPCTTAGSVGYGDIATGAEVDILDNTGKVLSIGQLQDGVAEDNGSCQFGFQIPDVPNGDAIYGVKVGNQARGVVHFTKAQMFGDGPQLTLGITP